MTREISISNEDIWTLFRVMTSVEQYSSTPLGSPHMVDRIVRILYDANKNLQRYVSFTEEEFLFFQRALGNLYPHLLTVDTEKVVQETLLKMLAPYDPNEPVDVSEWVSPIIPESAYAPVSPVSPRRARARNPRSPRGRGRSVSERVARAFYQLFPYY